MHLAIKPRHVCLLVLVTALWGFNFPVIKIALRTIPPITFSALRFLLVGFPLVFFLKKPALHVKQLMQFGLIMFTAQFAFLFSALQAGLSAGLASLLLQMQAFFTIGLAALLLHERLRKWQVLGTLVAASGIGVVAFHTGGDVTTTGLLFAMLAAMSWAGGNILVKSFGKVDMFSVVVWGGLFASVPLFVLAWVLEGKEAIMNGVIDMNLLTFLSLLYNVYISTLVSYPLWNRMIGEYSAGAVAPFSLLVPAFGMGSAVLVLNENYPTWKLIATLLIISGLILNQFGAKIKEFVCPKTE